MFSGCDRNEELTPDQFLEMSKKLGDIESAHNVSFLGVQEGYAVLEIWNGLAMRKGDQYRFVSVKLEKLPTEVQNQIRNAQKPWIAVTPHLDH